MSQRARVRVHEPTGTDLWIACGECGRETCHRILTYVRSTDASVDGDIQVWEDYYTVQCCGCKAVTFCHDSSCSEDIEFVDGEEVIAPKRKLYPGRIAGRPPIDSYELPLGIREVYIEAHSSLCNSCPILAGVGLRTIVEAVCKERSVAGRNLKEKINNLASTGLITSDAATILHSLRFMGNEAAHEIKAHNEAEINAAFDVIEILLRAVYVLPRRARQLPNAAP